MPSSLRVALFADAFHEPNGVATVSREWVTFAEEQNRPLCCVHAGPERRLGTHGSVTELELNRSWASFALDKGLDCDLLLNRHRHWVIAQLREFQPDVIHITGPGDFGVLGFWVAHDMGIPLAASWHTNLHEYASQRIQRTLGFLPLGMRRRIGAVAEKLSLGALLRFYGLARFVLAPNQPMVDTLCRHTHRPGYRMGHGVDTRRFSPALRSRRDGPFTIGYVGRLTPEKSVRWFGELERALVARGESGFRFLLVGDGSEREWLRHNLEFAELPGVLHGEALAVAFANMDLFVFPSRTDTFGLVILEAMASGVPVIVMPQAGERVGLRDGVDALVSDDFTASVVRLMRDEDLRKRMGVSARQTACSRSWSAVFEDVYRVYESALAP